MAAGHPERYEGISDKQQVVFSEGILVGYRWYDAMGIEPLFPFGYGLSYTTFAYSGLTTRPTANGADVTFTIKNTGQLAGTEIAEVYVGPPARPDVPMVRRSLSGFTRVDLKPGELKTVTVHIPGRQFAYWASEKKAWITQGGNRSIFVGASSRDIKLTRVVNIRSNQGQVDAGQKPGELAAKEMPTGRISIGVRTPSPAGN